jgi:hypothetical protein
MTKSKIPISKPTVEKKPRKPRKIEVFDQDYAWKDYISKDFFDCLAVVHPELYAKVDKSVPPEFLEQEMNNALRGKYKVKGKEKKTDKFVKLRLLNGEDYYIYVHLEVQDQLKDDFAERIYIYRSLISLRYMTQNITTIVIFTGKSPSEKHTIFKHTYFGSEVYYRFNYYVINDQSREALAALDRPFALAVLAAKCTLDTEEDEQQRLALKHKVVELAIKKQFPLDKIEELLSFVFDYMLLPKEVENEFMASPLISSLFKTDDMTVKAPTRGRKMLADAASIAIYGKPFDELLAEKAIEFDGLLAEKEAEKEAEKQAERQKTVQALLKNNFSPENIADILGLKLSYVVKIAKKYAASEG